MSQIAEVHEYNIPEWTFADRLRKVRKDGKFTQDQMAEVMGVTSSAYGNYEAGTSKPRDIVDKAILVEDWANLPRGWMLGFHPELPPGNIRPIKRFVVGSIPTQGTSATILPFPAAA